MKTEVSSLRRAVDQGMPYYSKLAEDHFPKDRGAKILDVGCGYGPLLFALLEEGCSDVSGIDAPPEQVRVAADLGLACVTQGDLLDTLANTAPETYDAIGAIDV